MLDRVQPQRSQLLALGSAVAEIEHLRRLVLCLQHSLNPTISQGYCPGAVIICRF